MSNNLQQQLQHIIDTKTKPERRPRDVFVYVIHEGKVRAPAAAMALMKIIEGSTKSGKSSK